MKEKSDSTENPEPKVSLHWGQFGLKMLLALVWLIGATAAASFTSKPDPTLPIWLSPLAVAVSIAPIVLNCWTGFKIRRLDEREQKLAFQSSFEGYGFAVSFGCLMWLSSFWEGAKTGNFTNFDPVSIIVLPALGFFFGEAMSQYARCMEIHGQDKSRP